MTDDTFITGIFDGLNPADFGRSDTTAIFEVEQPHHGPRAFDRFVEEMQRAVRFAFTGSEGQVNPVAVLANATTQRTFTPTDEETMGEYLDRLHDEATRMEADWVFVQRTTQVGTATVSPSQMHDITDTSMISRAQGEGALRDGVLWYAAQRAAIGIKRRHGIFEKIAPNALSLPLEAPSFQPMPLFDAILNAS